MSVNLGTDGKAGMIAMVDEHNTLDLKKLYRDQQKALPVYARPIFFRIVKDLDTTGIFYMIGHTLCSMPLF